LAGDGAGRGYRYYDRAGTVAGIRSVTLSAGRISMRAASGAWPCDLNASSERLPVTVDLDIGGERYCAEFGGIIASNARRRFAARGAAAPAACGKRDVTAANLNVLHGLNCDLTTRNCRVADRSTLLFQFVVASGCPDVITFQEIFFRWSTLIAGYQTEACPFDYSRVYSITGLGVDDQMILSRYPVVEQEVLLLYRDFRSLTYARIDHPIGPLDVVTTHLASSSDRGDDPCAEDCPSECVAAGAVTVRDCQAVQVAEYLEERHDVEGPALVAGDFNAPPGSFIYNQFAGRGWVDAYLAAGNPECDPLTGAGCTSGRIDDALEQLEQRASNENERIDFIFTVPPAAGSSCAMRIEPSGDPDGDGTSTGLFAGESNPFSETCGPMPEPICYPSDHQGVQLDLECAP
jgi:endonuclease/exonuclease/phosphatase family metal-dependent hydrolase